MYEPPPLRRSNTDTEQVSVWFDRLAHSDASTSGRSSPCRWTDAWPRRRRSASNRYDLFSLGQNGGPIRPHHTRIEASRLDWPMSRLRRNAYVRNSSGYASSDDWASSGSDLPGLPMSSSWLKALEGTAHVRATEESSCTLPEADTLHLSTANVQQQSTHAQTPMVSLEEPGSLDIVTPPNMCANECSECNQDTSWKYSSSYEHHGAHCIDCLLYTSPSPRD